MSYLDEEFDFDKELIGDYTQGLDMSAFGSYPKGGIIQLKQRRKSISRERRECRECRERRECRGGFVIKI